MSESIPEISNARRFGARIYQLNDGVVIVKQTAKSGTAQNAPYVIDGQRERHIDPGDDTGLAAAVRAALQGQL